MPADTPTNNSDAPPAALVAEPDRIRARLAQLNAEASALRKALRASEMLRRLQQKGGGHAA